MTGSLDGSKFEGGAAAAGDGDGDGDGDGGNGLLLLLFFNMTPAITPPISVITRSVTIVATIMKGFFLNPNIVSGSSLVMASSIDVSDLYVRGGVLESSSRPGALKSSSRPGFLKSTSRPG